MVLLTPIGNARIAIAELKNGDLVMIDEDYNLCVENINPTEFSIEIGGDIARRAYNTTISLINKK